jgi:hypothetical protein
MDHQIVAPPCRLDDRMRGYSRRPQNTDLVHPPSPTMMKQDQFSLDLPSRAGAHSSTQACFFELVELLRAMERAKSRLTLVAAHGRLASLPP